MMRQVCLRPPRAGRKCVFRAGHSGWIRGLQAENADAIGIHPVHLGVWTPVDSVLPASLGPLRPRSGGRGRDPRAARGGEVGPSISPHTHRLRGRYHLSSPLLRNGSLPLPRCAAERTKKSPTRPKGPWDGSDADGIGTSPPRVPKFLCEGRPRGFPALSSSRNSGKSENAVMIPRV